MLERSSGASINHSVKKTFQLNFNQLASGGVKKEFQFVGEIPNRIIYNREKEQKS